MCTETIHLCLFFSRENPHEQNNVGRFINILFSLLKIAVFCNLYYLELIILDLVAMSGSKQSQFQRREKQ